MSEKKKRPLLKVDEAKFTVDVWWPDTLGIDVLSLGSERVARLTVSEGQARILIAAINAALEQVAINVARKPTPSP